MNVHSLLENIIYNYTYPRLFALTFGYFVFLYFALAPLFLHVCRLLERKKLLFIIDRKEVGKKQLNFEKWHSLKSIVVFGFSVLPIIYLIRKQEIALLPDTWINILIGVIILTLWNEVHFFIIHRLMHVKIFMKNIHYVHHQSKIPTVYSVYSFHWIEAALLSTIPLTIAVFLPFSFLAFFIYPLVSVLLNFAGHCNYRFGNGKGNSWRLFGTRHNEHHSKGSKVYGFTLDILDKLFIKPKP